MFEKIKERIKSKSIEFYVENQMPQEEKPLELRVTLTVFNFNIFFCCFFLFLLSRPNFFTGIDSFGVFGITYAELLFNYLIIILFENVWSYFTRNKKSEKTPETPTTPNA